MILEIANLFRLDNLTILRGTTTCRISLLTFNLALIDPNIRMFWKLTNCMNIDYYLGTKFN